MKDNQVYFQSTSLNDVMQVKDKLFWEHTCDASKIDKDDVVLISINQKERKKRIDAGLDDYIGVTAVFKRKEKVQIQDNWDSDAKLAKEYRTRFYLSNIEYVKEDYVNSQLSSKRVNQRGLIYLDGRK